MYSKGYFSNFFILFCIYTLFFRVYMLFYHVFPCIPPLFYMIVQIILHFQWHILLTTDHKEKKGTKNCSLCPMHKQGVFLIGACCPDCKKIGLNRVEIYEHPGIKIVEDVFRPLRIITSEIKNHRCILSQ
jgi:hypothetical protein